MPTPIKLLRDNVDDKDQCIDYSFLQNYFEQPTKPSKRTVTASNNDAQLLFELWQKSKTSENNMVKVDESMNPKDIMRLKTHGFLTGGVDEVKFTKKGKVIITTMALSEPNRFINDIQQKSYSEILASNDKRGKKGYRIPKYATNNTNRLNCKDI